MSYNTHWQWLTTASNVNSNLVALVLGSGSLLYLLQKYIVFRRACQAVGNLPGFRLLLHPPSIISNLVPFYIPGFAAGANQKLKTKHGDFEYWGADIYATVSAFPNVMVEICTCDPAAVKEIVSQRTKFVKPLHQYDIIEQFGGNIVASEGEVWKKHRRIVNPAFSEPNNKLVWNEAVRITMDMIENEWLNKEEVVYDHANEITLQIALLIIGSAGFGRKISFSDDQRIPSGHTMSFKNSLHFVSSNILTPLVLPDWGMRLTEHLRTIRTAFKELREYMQEMIDARRTMETKPERFDLFTSLLDANMEEDNASKLADPELIGNVFVFLLAGHETTAHTLCFTLALLALHQDQQELLYQHIMSVLPDKRFPTYKDMPSLSLVQAFLMETLRLFPPLPNIFKMATEGTSLSASSASGENITVPVPKGAIVTIHAAGLHYNREARYWKDPFEFMPGRFMDPEWPRDAFCAFSLGARQCIGRRFAETESVAILATLLSRYSIEIKNEAQFAGESFEQRKARVLRNIRGVTTTPVRVPLIFKRRK